MRFQWRALCICTLYIAFAQTGDSALHLGLTMRALCRVFYRSCSTNPEVPVSRPGPATEVPCSNPATADPTAFAAPCNSIPKSPRRVLGSVRRKGELLRSLANLAYFIDKEINRNPALSVVRLNLEIEYGLDLRALAAGKLAGKSVHELVRVLGILTEVLTLLKSFPRAPPEHRSSPTTAVPITSESRGEEGNRNEPPRSSSPPAFDYPSTSTATVTSTIATERPMNPHNPEPPSTSSTPADDSTTVSTTSSTVTATEIPINYTEPPSSSSAPADDSSAISTAPSTVTTTEIPMNYPQPPSSSSAPADDSSAISTITSTVTTTEIPMIYPEPPSSSSTPADVTTTMATVKPTTALPKRDVFTVFPTRPDSGPPQWLDDDYYDYK